MKPWTVMRWEMTSKKFERLTTLLSL